MIFLKQEKSRERLCADLVLMQRGIEKELAEQERFIKQFQLFVQTEGESLPIIDLFSCPTAIFGRGGVLYRANRALMDNTGLQAGEILTGKINFLGRVTDENYAILEAAEGIFYGNTALLSRLSFPLELFCKGWGFPVTGDYHNALLFPLPDENGRIPFGVIMLMK